MLSKSIWNAYCGIYAELGEGPVSAVDIMDHTRLSGPMARKVIWELKNKSIMKKVGREGREVKYSLVSPIEGAVRLALSDPHVRFRHVMDFLEDAQVVEHYITGTTALNYHAPYHSPVLELACEKPARLRKIVEKYPYIRTQVSGRIPLRWEEVELENIHLRVASVEDAVIESYSNYPEVVVDVSSLDYMSEIALLSRGESLKVERLEELGVDAREHVEELLSEFDFTRDLREEVPHNVIEEEAKRRLVATPQAKANGMIETLTLPGGAVWPAG